VLGVPNRHSCHYKHTGTYIIVDEFDYNCTTRTAMNIYIMKNQSITKWCLQYTNNSSATMRSLAFASFSFEDFNDV